MASTAYHKRIVEYYLSTENAYKDSWDLNNSLAIHYGYWDDKVKTFPESLLRMNEVMMETAAIREGDEVLDAGCGVGGSSIFIATQTGARVTGITLSEKQVKQAINNAEKKQAAADTRFLVMDYSATQFPAASFDVVWGCESICYADDKEQFVKEAFRLLKPGGRLVVADGFVSEWDNNQNPVIRKWLDGWQVNYLETPQRFSDFMSNAGFENINYRNISHEVSHSVKRLYKFYFLAKLYLAWKTCTFSNRANDLQKGNISACKYQHIGMKKGLWQYGLIVGKKP